MATWDTDSLYWTEFDSLVHSTDNAYLLQINNENIWVPKLDGEVQIDEDEGVIGMPHWLAEKKGIKE